MTAIPLFAAIPVGGAGSRLRPATSPERPKPLLPMPDPRGPSLLAQALDRLQGLVPEDRRALVLGPELEPVFAAATPPTVTRLVEPQARGTGPALVLAARWAVARDPDAVLINCPADHWVADPVAWREAVARAAELAVRGWLVLIGVNPEAPDPGYGYILPGPKLHAFGRRVEGFREKPHPEEAERLVAAGARVNAGVFVWRAARFLELVGQLQPGWLAAVDAAARPDAAAWAALGGGSVDREILERLPEQLAVVPLETGWDDVGTWPRLRERMVRLGLAPASGPFVWAPGLVPPVDLAADRAFIAAADGPWIWPLTELAGLATAERRRDAPGSG